MEGNLACPDVVIVASSLLSAELRCDEFTGQLCLRWSGICCLHTKSR